MKKILAILALAATSSAFAGSGVNFEFERERGTSSPNTFNNTVKVSPYYKFDNGVKADIMFEGNRDDGKVNGSNQPLQNAIEARVQRLYEVYPGLKLGARLGIGEYFNGVNAAGNTVDFGYYTVEPKAEYAIGHGFSALASWRFRNGFNSSDNYLTRTAKAGVGYEVSKNDVVEVKYFQKRGDTNTNGVEFGYTRGF
jgi:hypothetical protein